MQICGLVTHIFSLSEKLIYYYKQERRQPANFDQISKHKFSCLSNHFFSLFGNRNQCRIDGFIQVEYSHISIESTALFTIFFCF